MEDNWSRISSPVHNTHLQQGFNFFSDAATAADVHPETSFIQQSASTSWHGTTQNDAVHRIEEINGPLETIGDEEVLPPLHSQSHDYGFTIFEAHPTGQASQSPEPSVNSRKRKARTLHESDWAPVKARVIELYYEEDLPLNEVKKAIERDPEFIGFEAT
jgi:hypothetical protein